MSPENIHLANEVVKYRSIKTVSKKTGLTYDAVRHAYRTAKSLGLVPAISQRDKLWDRGEIKSKEKIANHVTVEALPDPDEPIDDLIERLIKESDRKAGYEDARKMIEVSLDIKGPYAVVGIPDPHLNNPGTAIRMAFDHAKVIAETEGVFCIGVGDWLDNFIIGRLERERRGEKMSHSDANRLQEHYLTLIGGKLVGCIGGNHNDWPKMLGGIDPVAQIMKQIGKSGIYHEDEVRVRLKSKDGSTFVHLVRHIFPGHSKYNSVHGVLAWMLEKWQGEDVFWGGHIHAAGHAAISREWMGEERIAHGIQLASYKIRDGYAVKRGFRRNLPFIAPVVIHDPDRGKTIFFEDMEDGLAHLKMLRGS